MQNASDKIASRTIRASVNLVRLEAHLKKGVRRSLNAMRRELVAEINDRAAVRTPFNAARLSQLLKSADATISSTYDSISASHLVNMTELARVQAGVAAATVNKSIGAVLVESTFSATQLKTIASSGLIDGAPSAEWWGRQAKYVKEKFADNIRVGMLRGETVGELVARIQAPGTGLMSKANHVAETLVRSSVQTVNNSARLEVHAQNEDIFDGFQWISALDSETCNECASLDTLTWDNNQEPIGHGITYPGPIAHFGCRCTIIDVLKPWSELIEDPDLAAKLDAAEAENPGTRASMDGQVSAKMSYDEWLRSPGVDAKEILGPGKFGLWEKNKLSMADMVDQRGNPMTLAQIEAALK